MAQLAGADDRIEALEAQGQELRARAAGLCAELSAARRAAADRFAAEVATELAALAMPRARVAFVVTTTPDPDGLVLPAVAAASAVAWIRSTSSRP